MTHKPSFSPKQQMQALRFADSLDPKQLGPEPSPALLTAVQPAVDELKEIASLTMREIQKRLKENPEDVRISDLNKVMETSIKMSRLLSGESTDNVDLSATRILKKLTTPNLNDGPTVYEHEE